MYLEPRHAKALPESTLLSKLEQYERNLKDLGIEVQRLRDMDPRWRPESQVAWIAWYRMVRDAGPYLIEGILNTRVIPPGKAKAVEMTARLFRVTVSGRHKGPKDMVAWFDTNRPRLELVVTALKSWPIKTEETAGEQLFKVGPFTVHNTVGLTGDKLDAAKALLEKGIAAAKRSLMPGFERVLHGEVFLVGQIYGGAKTLAWYNESKDEVFIRPFLKISRNDVHSFVHELAHRYWAKFCPVAVKQAFNDYDVTLRFKHHSVEYPEAGKPLALSTEKGKPPPIVSRVDRGTGRIYLDDGVSGFVALDTYLKILRENAKKLTFPTMYSATKMTEHFAEAVALQTTGDLTGHHLEAFEQIVKGNDPTTGVPTLAVRAHTDEDAMKNAATYVRISREELEAWLDTLGSLIHGKWSRKPNRAGVYFLPLSQNVAVQLNSTIGTDDDAMGRGMAAMHLMLVSLVTGQVLNKKAQGQSHFKRTTGWQRTWKEGVARMRDAYLKSAGFYDALAEIEDRAKYQKELLALIESVPTWANDPTLKDFHDRLESGSILTIKQRALLEGTVSRARAKPDTSRVDRVRDLWRKAQRDGNTWLMGFAENVGKTLEAGKPLSSRQQDVLDENLARYRLASRVAARYLTGQATRIL